MKKYRLIAFLTAAAVPFAGFFGCSLDSLDKDSESEKSSEESEDESSDSSLFPDEYEPISLDDVQAHAEDLINDSKETGMDDFIYDDIEILLNDLDKAYEALSYITVAYYEDWYNEDLEAEYDSCYETYYIADEILIYAFSQGYANENYSFIFEDYIYPEYLEYYTDRSMSFNRLIGYAEVNYELMYENLEGYYDIVNDSKKNENTKNLEAAEIYLDILSSYDTDTLYSSYNRDFSGEEILSLTDTIIDELIPVLNSLGNTISYLPEYEEVYDNPVNFDDPLEVIAENGSNISEDIAEAAEKASEENLYITADGDDCYTGSFTIDLPMENSALFYVYKDGSYYDFLTTVHEFGHFYSSFYDTTTTYLMQNNIDIAEIQSQGMEVLFMEQYDNIYGDKAEVMRAVMLYDMLDSVASGFAVGEFEYTVLKNIDTMTPEDVVELFDSTMSKYDYEDVLQFYQVTHLFEQPGYYISYGVSALAALDIWNASLESYDDAVDMYISISRVPINSIEYQFSSALESCGFDDVLEAEYITKLKESVIEYTDSL